MGGTQDMRLSRSLFPVLYCLPPLCKWSSNPNPCRVHRSFQGFSLPSLHLCSSYAQGTRCWPASVRDLELFLLGLSCVEVGPWSSAESLHCPCSVCLLFISGVVYCLKGPQHLRVSYIFWPPDRWLSSNLKEDSCFLWEKREGLAPVRWN